MEALDGAERFGEKDIWHRLTHFTESDHVLIRFLTMHGKHVCIESGSDLLLSPIIPLKNVVEIQTVKFT